MQKLNLEVHPPPFRLGTTSYILPDEILPNVRYLADKVDDIELVLFEVDEGPNNLPSQAALEEMDHLRQDHSLTYSVHLPLDLHLGADGDEGHVSIRKARQVIEHVQKLSPRNYVVHLDGREVQNRSNSNNLNKWTEQACRSLEIFAERAGDIKLLAVENLEGYPPEFWDLVLDRVPASRCVDIGHLWLDHHDPLPFLEKCLPRTTVIHIHGVGERDHASLSCVAPAELDRVTRLLLEHQYAEVLTIEVFNGADFLASLAALTDSVKRIQREGPWVDH